MIEPERITPKYAREKALANEAVFVCAYDDEEKFRKMHLEGAIAYTAFKDMSATLAKDREIIFYCA